MFFLACKFNFHLTVLRYLCAFKFLSDDHYANTFAARTNRDQFAF